MLQGVDPVIGERSGIRMVKDAKNPAFVSGIIRVFHGVNFGLGASVAAL
jgi:hypothetical protein